MNLPKANVDHIHPSRDAERCPLCEQVLPQEISLDALQAKLQEKEAAAARQQDAALRAQFAQEMSRKIKEVNRQHAQEIKEHVEATRAEALKRGKEEGAEAMKGAVAKAEGDKRAALEGKLLADRKVVELREKQQEAIAQAVQESLKEQREVLEKDKLQALQKKDAGFFEDRQRWQRQVEQLKRQLEQQRANELGEGAEIDLFEALREAYEGDDIQRVKKGERGADIVHKIIHNGVACGTIVYDSKNHRRWLNSFVTKLKQDQIAAKADHAILVTSSFPKGANQLTIRDDVIVLNPARAVEMVRLVRQHLTQARRLRLSAQQRDKKTGALYEFITSGRCRQLMARHDTINEQLLQIDVDEKKAHDGTWKKRGKLLKESQKLHADYQCEIDMILEDGAET